MDGCFRSWVIFRQSSCAKCGFSEPLLVGSLDQPRIRLQQGVLATEPIFGPDEKVVLAGQGADLAQHLIFELGGLVWLRVG